MATIAERAQLEQWLAALEECRRDPSLKYEHPTYNKVITLIKEALAQPERHELQAKGEHPAPCARFCEANAFRIAERGYQRQIKELQVKLAQPEQEPVAIVDANDEGYWAEILPDRSVIVGQHLYAEAPQRNMDAIEIAGLTSSVGHLSALVDDLRVLLGTAMEAMKSVENSASPIDESQGDSDCRIPYEQWAAFVDERAKLLFAVKHSAHDGMLTTPPQPKEPEPVALDVTIEGDAAKLLFDMVYPVLQDDDPTSVRLIVGNGTSGYGLYIACAEYQDEGAVLLVNTIPPQRKPWVSLSDEQKADCREFDSRWDVVDATESKLRELNEAPQRKPLTWDAIPEERVGNADFMAGAKWAEAKLREMNEAPQRKPLTDEQKDSARWRFLVSNSFDKEGLAQFHVWHHIWEPHSQTSEPTEWKARVRGPALERVIDEAIEAAHGIKE